MDTKTLVIADPSVVDQDALTSSFPSDAKIIFLDSGNNTIETLSQEFTENDVYESVHIFTHGEDGSFELGDTKVDQSLVDSSGEPLNLLASHTSHNADLHIYGCNVAESEDGQNFLESLSSLLDVNIAASDDLTGPDGDLDLEFSTGELSSESVDDIDLESNLNTDWLSDLNDSDFSELVSGYVDDETLVYSELLDILQKTVDGGITETEYEDLETFYTQSNSNSLFDNNYLETITYNVIHTNKANEYWWGGVTDADDRIELGDMEAGFTEEQGDYLIGKWFLGTDTPMPVVGGDTANGSASSGVFGYTLATGDFWQANSHIEGDLIDEDDVNQGQAGTCYLLAAMGAIAHDETETYLEDAVTDNGNGTYGIRWFVDGETYYTTVDKQVITNNGRMVLTGDPNKALDGELWASLFEKGYAQLNSQVKVGDNFEASIQAVEGGLADPLTHITGLDYTYYSASYRMGGNTVMVDQSNLATYKQEIIDKLADGAIGWIGAWGDYKVDGKQTLVSGHAQALLEYNEADDTFLFQNPWGAGESSSWIGTYSLKIEEFWNEDVKPVIALTEKPDLKPKPEYEYEISVDETVVEGETVTVTITRTDTNPDTEGVDDTDTESTIYFSTLKSDGDDAASDSDFEEIEKEALVFGVNDNTQTITIDTYEDNLVEAIESFRLALYESATSVSTIDTATVGITNREATDFTYSITSDNSDESSAATEGDSVSFTITRDGSGERSVVYLSTENGTATTADFEELNEYALVFESDETEKTIEVVTSSDSSDEGVETFDLVLTESRGGEVTARATGNIDDYDAPSIDYRVMTDAATESGAVGEGQRVDFTISRSVTGVVSSVFVKTSGESAGSDDFEGISETVIFEPNQKEATVSVWVNKDMWLETNESFSLEVYRNESDQEPIAQSKAFIKDTPYEDYNYTLSSDGTEDDPLSEGENATITVTRDGSGNPSIVYLRTSRGSTGEDDFEELEELAVEFAAHEESKTVEIKTYTDGVDEGNESFNVELLRNPGDSDPTETTTIHVADTVIEGYTYSISMRGGGGDDSNEFNEGDTVEYVITREGGDSGEGSGTESTVYLSTSGVTASDSDFSAVNNEPLTFAPHETSKTFTVDTKTDDKTESLESFKLSLFTSEADAINGKANQTAEATLVDSSQSDNIYSYQLSGDKSVLEGEDYEFTILRSPSGSPSSVYVKTSFCNSDSSDFEVMGLTKVNFGSVEEQKTINVKTYNDNLIEGKECFWFEVYETLEDAENYNAIAKYRANIEDKLEQPVYKYSLTSSTEDKLTEDSDDPIAAVEGTNVTFTVKRELLNADEAVEEGASTIYMNTSTGTAGEFDFKGMGLEELNFNTAEDNEKRITVKVNTDSDLENEEYFWFNIFETYADGLNNNAIDVAKGRIEHKDPDQSYAYNITTENDVDNAVVEGGTISFKITREKQVDYLDDAASTTYIGTWEGSALADYDYLSLDTQELTFAAHEFEKVITIETIRDTNIESDLEEFWLMQYDSEADAENGDYSAYAEAFIEDDPDSEVLAYEITTNASKAGDLTEGEQVEITVTRKGADLNVASTIYIDTMNGTTTAIDAETMELMKLEFRPNEETKTFKLDTFVDFEQEGAEYFYVARYDTYGAAKIQDAADAEKVYVSDISPDSQYYNYEIDASTVNSEGFTVVNEGYDLEVTIRRERDTENLSEDVGSTVYISTFEGIAREGEFEIIDRMPVTFAADEFEKTVSIETFSNALNDVLPRNFQIGMFKTYEDAVWTTDGVWETAFIQEDATDHQFTISNVEVSTSVDTEGNVNYSDANVTTDDNSIKGLTANEGQKLKFTIDRTIGEQDIGAKVYINTQGGYSSADDYEQLNAQAFKFDVGQSTLDVELDVYRDSDATERFEYFWFGAYNNHYDAMGGFDHADFMKVDINDVPLANNYTITSSTNNLDGGAAQEGDTITFTIERDSGDGEETVYLRLYEETAERTVSEEYWNDPVQGFIGDYDPASLGDFIDDSGQATTSPIAMTFADGETVKTYEVQTVEDNKDEGIETFRMMMFGDEWDAYFADVSEAHNRYVASDVAHISDPTDPSTLGFNYNVTSSAPLDNPAEEGSTIEFTINRADGNFGGGGTGAVSNIWVAVEAFGMGAGQPTPGGGTAEHDQASNGMSGNSAIPGSSSEGDIDWVGHYTMQKLTFGADDNTLTFSLDVNEDDRVESLEELVFHVFDYPIDDEAGGYPYDSSAASVKAYIASEGAEPGSDPNTDPNYIPDQNYDPNADFNPDFNPEPDGDKQKDFDPEGDGGSDFNPTPDDGSNYDYDPNGDGGSDFNPTPDDGSNYDYDPNGDGGSDDGQIPDDYPYDEDDVPYEEPVEESEPSAEGSNSGSGGDSYVDPNFDPNAYPDYTPTPDDGSNYDYNPGSDDGSYVDPNFDPNTNPDYAPTPDDGSNYDYNPGSDDGSYVDPNVDPNTNPDYAPTPDDGSNYDYNPGSDDGSYVDPNFDPNTNPDYAPTPNDGSNYDYNPGSDDGSYVDPNTNPDYTPTPDDGSSYDPNEYTPSDDNSIPDDYPYGEDDVPYEEPVEESEPADENYASDDNAIPDDYPYGEDDVPYEEPAEESEPANENYASDDDAIPDDYPYGEDDVPYEEPVTEASTSSAPPSFGSSAPPSFGSAPATESGNSVSADVTEADVGEGSDSHPGHSGSLYGNKYAFAEIRDDGSVVAWGENDKGGDISDIKSQLSNVTSIGATHGAFAAITATGAVVAWGDPDDGGDNSSVSDLLNGDNDVVSLSSTHSAFAALHADGTVTTWGKGANGGNPSQTVENQITDTDNPVVEIFSNGSAFAAVHEGGAVTTWGYSAFGGDSSEVASDLDGSSDVVAIETTHSAFAALKADGSVVAWGNDYGGGDTSEADGLNGTDQKAVKLWSNSSSFAAVMDDGSVVAWGDPTSGGDISDITSLLDGTNNVVEIYSTDNAFVALMEDDSVVAWGDPDFGGNNDIANTLDGSQQVVQIVSNEAAFAAILEDGSVVTWGQNSYGGDSQFVSEALNGDVDVTSVVASGNGFTALREDGSVVSWGGGLLQSEMTDIQNVLDGDTDVVRIIANDEAFAAIDVDNNIYGWGNLEYGANVNGVDMSGSAPSGTDEGNGIRLVISGNAIQTRGGEALSGVDLLLDLVGAEDMTTTSAEDGTFSFDLESGNQDVTISANLETTEENTSSIDIDDALAVLNLSVGYGVTEDSEATADAFIAADFNGDGVVNAQDALEIFEYTQGLNNANNESPEWIFVDGDADMDSITKDNVNYDMGIALSDLNSSTSVNLTGILKGDVDNSLGG